MTKKECHCPWTHENANCKNRTSGNVSAITQTEQIGIEPINKPNFRSEKLGDTLFINHYYSVTTVA